MKIFEILAEAIEYFCEDEGFEPDEIHEVEIEQSNFGGYEQWAVYFPEFDYWCFSLPNSGFIGVKPSKAAA